MCILTIVDEGVPLPWTGLDLLETLFDRIITGEINMDRLNGIG